jgi:ABC-type nitrate/sulfonate/bicarbonate transport system ATPase subunit
MIQVQSLSFAYADNTPIFDGFDLCIARGETCSVLGPSGCGKTTLLYLLAGLQKPTGGQILIDGQPLTRPRPHTGLILQDYGLLPWFTVRQNVGLGLRVRDFYGPDGTHAPSEALPEADIQHWLERLGIAAVDDQYPARISGGQRQRAAIARTLVLQPDLLLMDEPFASLDTVIREDLQRLTLELCAEQGLTLVTVTHAIEEAAILGGKILLLGAPPNSLARMIDNPGAADPDHRNSPEYRAVCEQLREAIRNETA